MPIITETVFEVWSGVEGVVSRGTDRTTALLELSRALGRAKAANRSSLFDDSCELLVIRGHKGHLRNVIRRITVRGGEVSADIMAPGESGRRMASAPHAAIMTRRYRMIDWLRRAWQETDPTKDSFGGVRGKGFAERAVGAAHYLWSRLA